jgi:two-component system sensor histidine kinase KdpD
VNSQRLISIARWFGAAAGLVGIVYLYDDLVRVNSTSVALTMLLFILFLATRWGLRYAIATSLAATACYNFFFLPPLHTFTVSDPQNLVALFALLATSVVASRMSERVRDESRQALVRQRELEVLYSLSRGLLQTDELSVLTTSVPAAVANACRARSALFFLLQGDKTYWYGADWPIALGIPELRAFSNASGISRSYVSRAPAAGTAGLQEVVIPLRTGVRPRGVLLLDGVDLSEPTLEAIGGLVSVSLDRARAVEEATHADAARESERLRTMMMDSITHEIRSPLTAIKVAISTLRTARVEQAGREELLEVIEEEADRLNRLVAQSVEMAQLDTLAVTMALSPHDLAGIVVHVLHEIAANLAEHPVQVNLPSGLPRLEVDPIWMPKLLGNLLENAAKYSAAGAPIFISAEVRGDMIACSVADRGVGIEPLEQSLIFDKFYRSRGRAANISGTGMGLAICRAIAEAHGGRIEVTSQPGQGSVFTFTVRKVPAPA